MIRPVKSLGESEDIVQKCLRSVAEFRERLLRQLIPAGVSDEDAIEFLGGQGVSFVRFPDGREELHGFGRKLGDVFSGVEEEPNEGIKFVNRFTPNPKG